MAATSPARSAGVLLHPTSLPGPFGIGDLGPTALRLDRFAGQAGQNWWQVLPLGPTGFGDSPYQCFSAFAGNPLLVSPQLLLQDGLLNRPICMGPAFPPITSNYGPVIAFKNQLARQDLEQLPHRSRRAGSSSRFEAVPPRTPKLARRFRPVHGPQGCPEGRGWSDWPATCALREPGALAAPGRSWRAERRARISFASSCSSASGSSCAITPGKANRHHRRHSDLRLRGLGRRLGQPAAFPARRPASAARSSPACRPTTSAPRASSGAIRSTIGRPCKRTDYAWWVERLRAALRLVDLVRLDHFRGFEAYWEIPAGRPNAVDRAVDQGAGLTSFLATGRAEARRAAAHRRGPRRHHAGSRGAARSLRPARHARPAVCLRRPAEPLLAAQLPAQDGGLHRHARQRHTRGWYAHGCGAGTRSCPPLPGPRRQRHRLGPDAAGLVERGRLRRRRRCRTFSIWAPRRA